MKNRFAIIDFETTGLSPANGDRITEVAVVIVEADNIVDQYQGNAHRALADSLVTAELFIKIKHDLKQQLLLSDIDYKKLQQIQREPLKSFEKISNEIDKTKPKAPQKISVPVNIGQSNLKNKTENGLILNSSIKKMQNIKAYVPDPDITYSTTVSEPPKTFFSAGKLAIGFAVLAVISGFSFFWFLMIVAALAYFNEK